MTITWQVTEDGGGGLTLWVWDGSELKYVHGNYEYSPHTLRDDIDALRNGDKPWLGWDGNDMTPDEDGTAIGQAEYNSLLFGDGEYITSTPGAKVICDQDGPVDEDCMGYAGCSVFYPEDATNDKAAE